MDENACNYNPGVTDDDGSCEYSQENFDCEGNCLIEIDCAGECGGNAIIDECGVCGGDGVDIGACDCEGNIIDECDICGGNNESMDCNGECGGSADCDINISLDPYEFQDLVLFTNLNVEEITGLICIDDIINFSTIEDLNVTIGDCISINNEQSIQIYITNQFYITEFNFSLSGLILDSSTNGADGGLVEYNYYNWDIVGNNVYGSITDSSQFITGLTSDCTDNQSCEPQFADINDESLCIYPQQYWFDVDEDGLGDPEFDFMLCPDQVNDDYVQNNDDSCPNDPLNDLDDDGICADEDEYPDCFDIGDGSNPYDCSGECSGSAFIDDCNNCVGGNTGLEENSADLGCGCDLPEPLEYWEDIDGDGLGSGSISIYCLEDLPAGWILVNESELDPYPDCFDNFYDECDECGGDNTTGCFNNDCDIYCDCLGALAITYCIDTDEDGSGNSDPNTWITLCEDEYNNFEYDLIPVELGQCTDEYEDCNGVVDLCGICEGNNQNQDCNNDCFGSADIDDCGICAGGNTGLIPNADQDDCGVCDGFNTDQDCLGECFGSAEADDCGVCNGGMYLDENEELYNGLFCDCELTEPNNCGECFEPPCEVAALFPALIDNDYKNHIEVPIYLNGYANNSTGLEGFEFQFSYNNEYYILDDVQLHDNLSGYSLTYNDDVLNDSLIQVDVVVYAIGSPITDINEIVKLNFYLNDSNGDYSYLHNQITQLTFIDFKIGNSIIETMNGLVEFKTIMCLDSTADNFCNNEDPDIPSIPEEECLYYNNQEEEGYIITDGACEYIVEIETNLEDDSVLEDILLTNGDNSIQLFIESGVIMITSDDFDGQISFSEFYNIDILPNPTADNDTPLILWGEVVSFEPYEIIFEDESGQVIVTIEFTPFGERDDLEYDLYRLDNLNDTSWERVENQSCGERDCSGEIDSFGIFSVVIGGLGCIDAEACNFNDSAVIDDGSCFYSGEFGLFCYDGDEDGLGEINQESQYFCPDNIPDNWVNNCLDPEPDCPNPDPETILIDNCGICEGQNECFEYPVVFVDSWVLIEQNLYSDLYCFEDDSVPPYLGPFSANFTNEVAEECITYKIEISSEEPCEWIDGNCREIQNDCNMNDNQELCEFNAYCTWNLDLESCIESNNNCININNQTDCISNSEYSYLAQYICVTNEVYDDQFGGGWIYDEELSEIFEWGVSTNQICFNLQNTNDYDCMNYVFADNNNEIRLQHIDNNICFQETYQRISYLSINDLVIPNDYKLYKNFPNPFNPVTNIIFDLPKPDHVSLDIYNINGQHIDNITKGYFSTGSYEFKFNGDNLSSGIYFIIFTSNEVILSEKMILLK